MIEIGSAVADKGELGKGYLKLGELVGGSELKIPVAIINGKNDGPVLWLATGVHGDELNGFMSLRRVINQLNPSEMNGALICTPMINPLAMQWRNKVNPYDFLDMCQQFPGKADGQYSQQAAYILFENIKKYADCLIDFHTAGTPFYADPYTVFKFIPSVEERINIKTQELALAFQTKMNCRVDVASATGELPGGVSGNLDVTCMKHGIAAFMAEIGSGGEFQEENIEAGIRGISNVMKKLGIISGTVAKNHDPVLITERTFLYSRKAGILNMKVKSGQMVKKKEKIGEIVDLFSVIEEIEAPRDSLIIQVRTNPIVHMGDRVCFLGFKWSRL